jgi:hypothetical protein
MPSQRLHIFNRDVAPEKDTAPLKLRKIQRKEFRGRCRSTGAERSRVRYRSPGAEAGVE